MSKKKKIALGVVAFLIIAAGAFAAYSVTAPDIVPGDIVTGLDPSTGVPTSGTWSFKLDIGNPGTAYLYSDPDFNYVVLYADGQQVFFYNQSFIVPYTYQSNPRTQGNSTAYFEFTAVDSDVIDGYVYHDQGVQSFHMELIDADLPDNEWFELREGVWNVSYDDVESDCEDGVVAFPDLPNQLDLHTVYDLDTGEPSGEMRASFGNTDIYLEAGDHVNVYSQDAPFEAGVPIDEVGDVLLDYEHDTFSTEFEFFGVGEDLVEGVMTITGSNGCKYTGGFTAAHGS